MIVLAVLLQVSAAQPYWQQQLSYRIEASLDEGRGRLVGTEQVVYRNHSPDTLRTVAFHLYLNAFRPGSRWADADSVERRRRFNDLVDPDFGMNQVSNVTVMGEPATPIYPFAPDSTVVRFALPRALRPGDSMVVTMDWAARPSTVPRRQGRRGRAFDFAQWYPRVVAYDKHGWQEHPLYPAGEFYGDFGDFTVVLDVPEDQVVGSTGVPLCGDPGWERANQTPSRPIEYRREFYPAALAALPSDACAAKAPGRKTIVWQAEDVHHFAMSMRPDYRYEGGRFGDVSVHALYQPGDEKTWGGNVAVKGTEVALEWLDGLFGKYPWPQITNVHRIEGGGTEFPMMIHDGSADLGLILHELGHNYLMGVLANNEWREGFLDEGFTSFQTTWFYEATTKTSSYPSDEQDIVLADVDGWSEPTSLVSERYRDFATYSNMIYTRGELFFHQLREIVGPDTMRQILRTYYDRWKLKHVDEGTFKAVAEEVSGRDLSAFFAQWLHSTVLYDYSVGRVRSSRRADGRWVSRIEVQRKAPGVFPVEVAVRSKTDTVTARVDGAGEREWIEVVTASRPREVVIDPRVRSHDWNMLNNRKVRSLLGWGTRAEHDLHLDRVFSTRVYRDRIADAVLPAIWFNDEGGVTIGLRTRSNYLGRFSQLTHEVSVATRRCCSGDGAVNRYLRLENPTWLHVPRVTTRLEAFQVEGRDGIAISAEKQRKGHLGFGATTFSSLSLGWLATSDTEFLDPALYDNAGTIEATAAIRSSERRGAWRVRGTASLGAGVEYRNRGAGVTTADRHDTQAYLRLFGEAVGRRPLGSRAGLGIRLFGGWLHGDSGDPVRQRWFYLAGADPYQQIAHPLVRSRGAVLTGDVHWQQPGGANVRGLAREVAVTRLLAANAEVERSLVRRPKAALFREIKVAGFGDMAWSDGFFSTDGSTRLTADLGLGLRLVHHLGQTTFTTRLDLPLLVSHPDRAIGAKPRDRALSFRWIFGLGDTF